jgi:threonine synthase
MRAHLRCHRCDWVDELCSRQGCARCGGTLEVGYSGPWPDWQADRVGVWRYRSWLPVAGDGVTLGEGGTPLLRSRAFGSSVYLKDEGANPTRSFKDRPVAVATAMAIELGASGLMCASTGNTAVSVAAYGARVGLPVECLVPDGTPRDKLDPIAAAGARLRPVAGTYSDAHAEASVLAARSGWANLTTTYVNPFMIEGDKTLGLELFEQLGRAPDAVIVPVGAGPLLAAIGKAFVELRATGRFVGSGPRLFAVQAAGCAPIARAFREGAPVRAWGRPDTAAGAIADPLAGYVGDGDRTLAAVRASCGAAIAVGDDEMARAARQLAASDGITVELSAAAAAAGWLRLREQGCIAADDVTVLVLTAADRRAPRRHMKARSYRATT